jgi:FG-GAP-like repeat
VGGNQDGPPNSIYVFLGNGDGTFQNPVVSNPNIPYSLGVVGDCNGDGKLDLIAFSSTAVAFIQGNGDGTFQTPSTSYTLGPDTETVIAADLNGDDNLDLIAVQMSPTNTFTVLLGNGDGTFNLQTPVSVGSSHSGGVAIGDLNADGKLDLILSDEHIDSARKWRRNFSKRNQVAVCLNRCRRGRFQ